jgi:uncharacterized membrane protein
MDPTLAMILGVLMRWLHVSTVVVLIGGVLYAWRSREPLSPAFRILIWPAIILTVAAGVYNFLTKPSYPPHYHMWFGIKMLFVLHIIAVLGLLSRGTAPEAKQHRWMASVGMSALIVFAISAYLRWISLSPVVKLP